MNNMIINQKQLSGFYLFEQQRLDSFKSWPHNDTKPCNINKLAEAGFYWCGTEQENDSATCFLCDKTLHGWESSDEPWMEHSSHAPQCEFVKFGRKESELTIQEFYDILKIFIKKEIQKSRLKALSVTEELIEAAKGKMSSNN